MTRFSLSLFTCMIALAGPALAQGVPKTASCNVHIKDAIVPLKPPTFSSVVEWRRTLGMEGLERIEHIMALADGGIAAIGESRAYSRAGGTAPPELYVIRLNVSGKPVFEKRIPVENLTHVAGGVVLKDHIVVVSQIEDDQNNAKVRVDFMDGTGTIKSTFYIEEPGNNVSAGDIVINADNDSLTLAAMTVSRKDEKDFYTVLYRLSQDGKIISRREFLPGVPNRIERLERLNNGQIVGAGRIRIDGRKEGGWLLHVSRQGDIVMQRPYARGKQARLTKIIDDRMGGMYALGEAIPSDGGYRAGWIMRLDGEGDPKWQRFLSGKYRYSAADMALQKDGRLMVVLSGSPGSAGGREHARIITMSSAGDILHDESYLEGSNAVPVRILEHPVSRRRILAGYAQTDFADGLSGTRKLAAYDAWFSGLTMLPAFKDSCKAAEKDTLDGRP